MSTHEVHPWYGTTPNLKVNKKAGKVEERSGFLVTMDSSLPTTAEEVKVQLNPNVGCVCLLRGKLVEGTRCTKQAGVSIFGMLTMQDDNTWRFGISPHLCVTDVRRVTLLILW